MFDQALRIVAWNLGHKCTHAPLSHFLFDAVEGLCPDLLLFNEYVEYPDEEPLKLHDRILLREHLREYGLSHWMMSVGERRSTKTYENRVIAYSRFHLELGKLQAPEYSLGVRGPVDAGHRTNFLHLVLQDLDIEVIAIRVPWFDSAGIFKAYWNSLLRVIRSCTAQRIVIVGDLNIDLRAISENTPKTWQGRVYRELCEVVESCGMNIPCPDGEFSSANLAGKTSCLDYALLRGVNCRRAEYVHCIRGLHLVGKIPTAISNHAPLVLDLELI